VSSLLIQFCNHSDFPVLSENGRGSRDPSDDLLIGCLEAILKHPGQAPVYIITDGLDECPNTFGMLSPREKILMFVEELVDLHFQNLHICVTNRSEVDITIALNSLHSHTVDLQKIR
jgi:hypothetical protein